MTYKCQMGHTPAENTIGIKKRHKIEKKIINCPSNAVKNFFFKLPKLLVKINQHVHFLDLMTYVMLK